MIKANEYRVGIWVQDIEPYDKLHQVDLNMLINAIGNNRKYRPIPLTAEWLERCGFVEAKKGFYIEYSREDTEGYKLDFLTIRRHEVSSFYELGREHENYFEIYTQNKHKILYLHQLQNLYFALTGEELQIKMP